MKKPNIIVKEEDWEGSKFRTQKWETRVNIINWEHNYEEKEYKITLG